ncbi:MAG: N-acyl-D-amino-acid deacylase [Candidatus Sumerlaeota bacterium]|nr:N-acyl-D-amino-acid deacylase [Candidatus Sumerlaeota bacterium]
MRCLLIGLCVSSFAALSSAESVADDFETPTDALPWTIADGTGSVIEAATAPRLSGIALPNGGLGVFQQAADENTGGVHLALTGGPATDMTAEAWVFCEGNDGAVKHGGYQGIVASASQSGSVHMIRLAWDPDHQEPGDSGDGWVKLQAHDGVSWDYLGIDPAQHGAATQGYIVNGTSWPSGWHRFRLTVEGNTVSAYVDDMDAPAATGTLSLALRNGGAGFYTYSNGDYAGYFDDFTAEFTPLPEADYDVLILNGTVYRDGDSDPVQADVGIRSDRIAAIGELDGATASRTIDATGLLVVPGFIDTHCHADGASANAQYLRQGVTTMVNGNCGASPSIPTLGSTYDGLAGRLGTNYIGLIGHNQLRANVGLSGTTPTPAQMQQMKANIATGMQAGAFGFSTGLIYYSGFNSTTEEVIELAAAAKEEGGLYATHMRSEGEDVLAAVEEALRIGRESGARVQISHAKCVGPAVWGFSDEFLALVDQAIADGVDVWLDQYPYTASQTTIDVLIPDWAESNWSDAVNNRREELEQGIRDLIAGRGGADRVYLISGSYARQYLSDVATSLGKDPEDVIIDNIGRSGASAIYHTMQEDDVRTFIVHPRVMMGSDGPTGSHPRGQGTFPRLWGTYGRELGFFDQQECIRKTSTLAARQFRLLEQARGRIETGFFADIVVLDPDEVIDRATFDSPSTTPLGIPFVLVNGEVAVSNGTYTGTLSGRVLRSYDSKTTASSNWVIQ